MTETFEAFFERDLQQYLTNPDQFEEAIALLEEAMPRMATSVDRSKVYQWLGTLHVSLAARALQASLVNEAQQQFGLVEEYQSKAIEESPARPEPRLCLARYYLTFGMRPDDALEVLGDLGGGVAGEDPRALTFEHQRLALRGVALTMLNRGDEAAQALDAAYSDRFAGLIPPKAVDVPSLLYLATRGIKFSRESARAIIAQLHKLGLTDADLPENLEDQLTG